MRRAPSTLIIIVLTLVLVSANSCASDSDDAGSPTTSAGPSTGPSTTAAPNYTPVFETGPCDAERVPAAPAVVECGTLIVPEDRSQPDVRQVRLPVAITRASQEPKKPDPIVYFSGGPGSPGLSAAKNWSKVGLDPTRDVITFDQRGTGASQPSLECAEVDDATFKLFETADTPVEERPAMLAAFTACRQRLVAEGIDLNQFNTPQVGNDVADLRTALGIGDWNIFGVSYGTTVALEMLRSHPQGVRSAVIDSVYPTDIGMGPADFPEAERVFGVLADGCAKDAACNAAYPDLRALLTTAVDRLDATPYSLDIDVGDRVVKGLFTGTDLIGGLFNALYDTELIPLLPLFISSVAKGNVGILDAVAQSGINALTKAAEGQTASVDCADRQRIIDQAQIQANIEKYPLYGLLATARPIPELCPSWQVDSVDPAFNTMPETTIPTLVFGDEYDPVTAPKNSERTAKALGAAATFVLFPGLGHGATDAHPCPLSIFQAFVTSPTDAVDTACVATMPPPKFTAS